MTPVIAAAALSSLLTSVWHELRARHEARVKLQASCVHTYGAPVSATVGFKVFCSKCRHQEFAHADGSLCSLPCDVCGRGKH